MATYKGKYTSNANGLYDLELYEDSTVKETATNICLLYTSPSPRDS